MLTLDYNDYRIHIDNTGNVEYARLDNNGWPVVTHIPPAAIVTLAGSILQLVATDVVRAEMMIAGIEEDLRVAKNNVDSAESSEFEAVMAGNSAKLAQSELTEQLKAAKEVLQSAKAKQSC